MCGGHAYGCDLLESLKKTLEGALLFPAHFADEKTEVQ
jgi:hypothetical protein